ncbi:MAG: exonuclease domain-containing protein [Bacteroidia bacterium]
MIEFYAKKYWDLGLNVTAIGSEVTEYNFDAPNILKSPNHRWIPFFSKRQNLDDFNKLNWHNATGIGTLTGQKNFNSNEILHKLMLIDIDGCNNLDFIRYLLEELNLPIDYEWLIKSGSGNGYHLYSYTYVYSDLLSKFPIGCAYNPNKKFENEFLKLELLWHSHSVLPPSLHMSGLKYEFLCCKFPKSLPQPVDHHELFFLLKKICDSEPGYLVSTGLEGFGFPKKDNNIPMDEEPEYNNSEYIVIDIETDELVTLKNGKDSYPNILQISWIVLNSNFEILKRKTFLVKDNSVTKNHAFHINKLDINLINEIGVPLFEVLREISLDILHANTIVAHNTKFDIGTIGHHLSMTGLANHFNGKRIICTMESAISLFPNNKFPTLEELYSKLFGQAFINGHNSCIDSVITLRCFKKLKNLGLINEQMNT